MNEEIAAMRDDIEKAVRRVAIKFHDASAEAPIGSRERADLIMKSIGAFAALQAINHEFMSRPVSEATPP